MPAETTDSCVLGESYEFANGGVRRTVTDRKGQPWQSWIPLLDGVDTSDAHGAFDQSWLRAFNPPRATAQRGEVRIVDLFAGCGGLTLGLQEAARAFNLGFQAVLANDIERAGLDVYAANFPGVQLECGPIESILNGDVGSRLTPSERRFSERVGDVDIVVGGPPCQGHSDLNNHTRRADPKNELYLRMARFCEVVKPAHVVIENVPGVLHDRARVAQRTWNALEGMGYTLATGTLDAQWFGAAQRRKRNFTIASRIVTPNLAQLSETFAAPARSLMWAIGDLASRALPESVYDSAPTPRAESRRRIDYLFDHDLYELPDEERPDCHRLKAHTYKSMYGRMRPNLPAQTITTGFGVMGRGRYVHPTMRRTLTPHEAARIQGFPDFFSFGNTNRTALHTLIGNAVPSKLGYVVGGHLLA